MSTDLPVHWLSLGGTLQARGHDPLDVDRYWQTGRSLTPEEVLDPVRSLVGPVTVEAVASRPSHDLAPEDLLALVRRLRALDPAAATGVVLTLGSNGLEEVAFLAWLLGAPVPVVVSAAMRPPTAVGSDALPNLVDALAVARSVEASEHGVLVVSDGAVLHPAEVMKSHSSRLDSFRASATPVADVRAGVTRWHRAGRPGPLRDVPVPAGLAPVEIVTSYLGADGAAVRSAVDRGARAVVSAGTGAGFPTGAERRALEDAAAAGVVVCQAQRTPYGSVAATTGPLLCARELTPQKARLLLATALATERPRSTEALQRLLDDASR
ncbi:asparaginase [Nocardioides carbamazepini]|uniref:asparaginase n=1 Tax=Nocardioides carbamazepini TaxID=2854259 RepID=UPI00214A62FA|nr:asparaginase domain-containing protein [Nocardioides carbamazepini]MCR1784386.1 asparaginase [Nocardioides carbamazepini]